MKKCISLFLTIILCSSFVPAFAEPDISVTLDGEYLSFDVPPQIINDRTMVPLRTIFEALGARVDWNEATQTVTSAKDNKTIQLTIDSNIMYVNNNAVMLDVPACVINDRTLVPIRAVAESFECNVDYYSENEMVEISTPSDNLPIPQNCYAVSGYGRAKIYCDKIADESNLGYEIYYATNENGPYSLCMWTTGIGDSGVECRDLQEMQTYYFKIRTTAYINNKKIRGRFSEPFSTTIKEALSVEVGKPKITEATVDGTSVTLRWESAEKADKYHLYIDGISALIYGIDDIYGNSYTITDLEPNTRYEFSIIGSTEVLGQSYSGEMSDRVSVTTDNILYYSGTKVPDYGKIFNANIITTKQDGNSFLHSYKITKENLEKYLNILQDDGWTPFTVDTNRGKFILEYSFINSKYTTQNDVSTMSIFVYKNGDNLIGMFGYNILP